MGSIVAEIPRNDFINSVSKGEWLLRTGNFMESLRQEEKERLKQVAEEQRQRASMYFDSFMRAILNTEKKKKVLVIISIKMMS